MSLMKKILFGMGVAFFADASMVRASEMTETKSKQIKHYFMERIDKISKPIIEKIDKCTPNYTSSTHYFTGLNTIPLLAGYFMTSKMRYGFGAFATIVPLCNTYYLYQFDKKMETLFPSPTEYDDFQEPYNKNKKFYHLLNGGTIVGSTLATTCTKKYIALPFLCYSLIASIFQGMDLNVSNMTLKIYDLNSAIHQNIIVREENSRERIKFMELLHRSKDT